MVRFHSLPLALGLAALAAPALAQAPQAAEPDIIVTVNRIDTPLDASTAAVSVLDEAALERLQTVFVADALSTLPGVTVTQNGPFGGQASVRIRGGSTEHTLVLIDGVSVNDPTSPGGGFDAAFLDANAIERIEVLRGPQSTLWGSEAIGGVINVVTKRPSEGFTGALNGEAGSFGTFRTGVSLGFGGERFDARVGAATVRTDGISKADKDDGAVESDPYDSVTLDGRLGLKLAGGLRLEAFGRYNDSRTAFDSFGVVTGVADGDEVADGEDFSGGLAAKLSLFDGRFENLLIVSRAEVERTYRTDGVETFDAEGFRDTWRYQGTARPIDGLVLAFGAERDESDFRELGSTRTDGLFLLAEAKPVERVTITGGVRRDDHSTFGDVTTARFGIRWELADSVGVRASWGQGFKAPTVFQVSGGGFVPANPGLQPEEAEGWDAAIFVSALGGRLFAEVGAFDLETENLINFAFAGYTNIARAESAGIEATARLALTETLTLAAAYTMTDAVDAASGRPILLIPDHAGFVEADWRATDALGLTATLRYNGEESETVRTGIPDGVLDSWIRLDLAGRYRVSEQLEVYGRIDNLLDENYQDIFGYGTPGRSGYVGLRVRFE